MKPESSQNDRNGICQSKQGSVNSKFLPENF